MIATPEEAKWINEFKRLAKRCPPSLWLYAGENPLSIMRYREEDGKPAFGGMNPSPYGYDQAYIVGTVKIANDGGDW